MGDLHLATHERLPGQLVVKVLSPDLVEDHDAFMRFQQEAVAMANIRHPNVVHLIDFNFTQGGLPYLVMEYLPGRDLAELLCARRTLSAPEVSRVVHQVACALDAAHQRGVVHRDLKPENIMVVPCEGQDDLIKVIDFGISKAPRFNHVTAASMVIGTPEFMSPEQAQGRHADIDARSDQFALAVISYLLLTGRTPWGTTAMVEILHRVVNKGPLPLRSDDSWPMVETVLFRGMAKNPADRFPSILAFWRALEQAMVKDGLLAVLPNQPALCLMDDAAEEAERSTTTPRTSSPSLSSASSAPQEQPRSDHPTTRLEGIESGADSGPHVTGALALRTDPNQEIDHDDRVTVRHREVKDRPRRSRVADFALLVTLGAGACAGLLEIPNLRVRAGAAWQSVREFTSRVADDSLSEGYSWMSRIRSKSAGSRRPPGRLPE